MAVDTKASVFSTRPATSEPGESISAAGTARTQTSRR